MVTMQWKRNIAGQVEAQWTQNAPKMENMPKTTVRHLHKTRQPALKALLRRTWH